MPDKGARSPGASSNFPVRVLQISDDPGLASTRLLVLQNAGFLVEHRFSSLVRAGEAFRPFRVIVLCQSIEPKLAEQLSQRICAEAPDARILRVRLAGHDQVLSDASIAAPVEPQELVRAVERLAGSPRNGGN